MAEEETLAEEPQAIAEAGASAEAHEQQPQARPESEVQRLEVVSKREAAEVLQDPFLEALLLKPDDYEAYERLVLRPSKRKFESTLHEGDVVHGEHASPEAPQAPPPPAPPRPPPPPPSVSSPNHSMRR